MRMNSAPGKEILALVREGDYAHPGEADAVDMVFRGLTRDPERLVLDVGCGRGGTADLVHRRGWGTVTGIDIDAETLDAAASRYTEIDFRVLDAGRIGEVWQSRFDLIYLFNAFYAFPDQTQALREMHRAAREKASLMIFDYTGRDGSPHDTGTIDRRRPPFSHQGWSPLHPKHFPELLRETGWQVEQVVDFSAAYLAWYRRLCERIGANRERIESGYGAEWYEYVLKTYVELYDAIENGRIGGAAYWARRA
ncbi:class I SAM-dependent methyltransferase [Geomesophilobacter sediminis]|uniref:Methyltransferase domain-containing protein n=1 Tax=Geomesophilobacter sediminis TaxID=2798584 RepID=A0A8J7IMX7_9BACT|nr:class I SAM-dependent methyltransferase [Geomesophilobacter sediminis]MBJ6724323.1 methyltransferase domain-containing protein [Geomesophilobacter sediminis]